MLEGRSGSKEDYHESKIYLKQKDNFERLNKNHIRVID